MNPQLRALATLIAAAMVLTACGGGSPDKTTYRDADDRTLFELPNDWNLYPADELVQIGRPVPFLPDIGGYRPISFVAFDGAAGRSLENLKLEVAMSPYPIGAQIVRQIGPDERSLLSRHILALSAYDMVNAAQGIQMIESEDFSFGRDYDGVRRLVGVTNEDGRIEGAVYILAVTNPEVTEIYSMAAGCSLACFNRQSTEIFEAVNSWAVNTRR